MPESKEKEKKLLSKHVKFRTLIKRAGTDLRDGEKASAMALQNARREYSRRLKKTQLADGAWDSRGRG